MSETKLPDWNNGESFCFETIADKVAQKPGPCCHGENGHINQIIDYNEDIYKNIHSTSAKSSDLPCRKNTFTDPNLSTMMKPKPKPSQRRWLVLAASFISMTIASGFPYSLSILYVEFLAEFGRSKAETVMITSFCVGSLTTLGCIYGRIISNYGPRKVGIVGAFQFSASVGASYFATSIGSLIGTLGILAGSGISGIFMGSMANVAEHFDGRAKVSAASFMAFGTGLSTIVFPLIINSLINTYGWRGCLLVMSGIILNLIPCFLICKSRETLTRRNEKNMNQAVKFVNKTKACHKFFVEVTEIMRNKIYVVFTVAISFTVAILSGIMAIYVDFLVFNGFSRDEAVLLFLYMNIVGTCLRIISGFVKRLPHISIFSISIVHAGVGLLSCIFLPFAVNYLAFVVLTCTFGFAHGGIFSGLYMTTMKILGAKKYSTGFGILITFAGICSMMITPVFGLLRDISGSYDMGFYVAGTVIGIGLLLFCIALFLRKTVGLETDSHVVHITSRKRSSLVPWKGGVDFKF